LTRQLQAVALAFPASRGNAKDHAQKLQQKLSYQIKVQQLCKFFSTMAESLCLTIESC
jgi:hypothetical protein